ncbi:MAG: hypothetical protein R3A11_06000 [Bdellovibrionota bacterium]
MFFLSMISSVHSQEAPSCKPRYFLYIKSIPRLLDDISQQTIQIDLGAFANAHPDSSSNANHVWKFEFPLNDLIMKKENDVIYWEDSHPEGLPVAEIGYALIRNDQDQYAKIFLGIQVRGTQDTNILSFNREQIRTLVFERMVKKETKNPPKNLVLFDNTGKKESIHLGESNYCYQELAKNKDFKSQALRELNQLYFTSSEEDRNPGAVSLGIFSLQKCDCL